MNVGLCLLPKVVYFSPQQHPSLHLCAVLQWLRIAECSEMSAYQKQAITKGQQCAVQATSGTVVPSPGHSFTQGNIRTCIDTHVHTQPYLHSFPKEFP